MKNRQQTTSEGIISDFLLVSSSHDEKPKPKWFKKTKGKITSNCVFYFVLVSCFYFVPCDVASGRGRSNVWMVNSLIQFIQWTSA